jgi:hypothetical protein
VDLVQFLLSVINLILALVVLFGGRLFLSKVAELQSQIDVLKTGNNTTPAPLEGPAEEAGVTEEGHHAKSLEWK